jgi:hypothetical protein
MRRDKPKTMRQECPDMIEESSGNVFADLELENPEEPGLPRCHCCLSCKSL